MSKPAKKRLPGPSVKTQPAGKLAERTGGNQETKQPDRTSKQSRVIAMLRSPNGATISAMMKATGWQQHSVRGFLAGVVRKRLKLRLDSQVVDDNRVYRVIDARGKPAGGAKANRRARPGP